MTRSFNGSMESRDGVVTETARFADLGRSGVRPGNLDGDRTGDASAGDFSAGVHVAEDCFACVSIVPWVFAGRGIQTFPVNLGVANDSRNSAPSPRRSFGLDRGDDAAGWVQQPVIADNDDGAGDDGPAAAGSDAVFDHDISAVTRTSPLTRKA
jgi:hypothetical protein